MQQLQQFPKAQKLFKNYVESHIEHMIDTSQSLADRYIKERENVLSQSKTDIKSRREIKKMIYFLDKLLAIPEHLRQNIEEYRGMSNQEIQERKRKYGELLEIYGFDENQQDFEIEQQIIKKQKNQLRDSPKPLIDSQKNNLLPHNKKQSLKLLVPSLKILQVLTCILVFFVMAYRLLF